MSDRTYAVSDPVIRSRLAGVQKLLRQAQSELHSLYVTGVTPDGEAAIENRVLKAGSAVDDAFELVGEVVMAIPDEEDGD
jgi:hypothetical protein